MPSITTKELKIKNSEISRKYLQDNNVYCFIAKDTTWDNELEPDIPLDTDQEKIQLFQDIQAIKKVNPDNSQYVTKRYDWNNDTVYTAYDHRIDLTNEPFYVLTDDYNVYKCLDNNGGSVSTVKPTGVNINPSNTIDGYRWKYLYTLTPADISLFLTPIWMPCYTLYSNNGSIQWLVQTNAVDGSIENIKLTNAGVGYTNATVTITGDGNGATAIATINQDGNISSIVVTNVGIGYTQATVTITGDGVNALGDAILSPVVGHGSNPKSELLATRMLVNVLLEDNENGNFPLTQYRQAGLIVNPQVEDGSLLNDYKLTVTDASYYRKGDTIVGLTSGASGIIVLVDEINNLVYIQDATTSYNMGELVESNNTNTSFKANILSFQLMGKIATNTAINASDIIPRTGNIVYYSNRTVINRSINQTEEIRFLIEF